MASVNKVIILGNLGKDPEVRTLPNGDAVANITVATTEKWKDKNSGEAMEATEWHRVSFFGRLAEIAGQYLFKGSSVYIEGSLKTRKYTDKAGIEKYTTEIHAYSMQMLSGKPEQGTQAAPQQRQAAPSQAPAQRQGASSQQRPAQRQAPQRPATGAASDGFSDMDDDIPYISNALCFDMDTSKQRRMARYEF